MNTDKAIAEAMLDSLDDDGWAVPGRDDPDERAASERIILAAYRAGRDAERAARAEGLAAMKVRGALDINGAAFVTVDTADEFFEDMCDWHDIDSTRRRDFRATLYVPKPDAAPVEVEWEVEA